MPLRPNMEPKEYLEIILRRKWLVLFSVILVMLGASVYCVAIPDQFKSSTTILVIPPSVSKDFVRGDSDQQMMNRMPAIQQQVLSRTRLIAIMDNLGLYREEKKKIAPELLVRKMQDRIETRVIPEKQSFTLSFVHENPRMAMITTSMLSSLFLEENMRAREQQMVSTGEFLDDQMKETKARLEVQEEKVKRYKMMYMGELPEEMQSNLNRMTRLEDQVRTSSDAIAKLEDRKLFIESKISDLQKEIAAIESGGGDPEDPTRPLLEQIAVRRKKIRELSLVYTSKYPTVLILQREVEELKKKVESVRKSRPPPKGSLAEDLFSEESEQRVASQERQEMARLREQVANLNLEISSIKKEKEEARKTTNSIQAKVARMPQREQEMISLRRDYENLKSSYNDKLNKKLDAKVAQNLEQGRKGETFAIIEPPNLPSEPFVPDRLRIMGLAFLAASGLAFGGAIGREMLDETLQGPKDFKYFFELPILASLPVIQEGGGNLMKRSFRTALLIGLCSVLSAVTLFLLMYRENIQAFLEIPGRIG